MQPLLGCASIGRSDIPAVPELALLFPQVYKPYVSQVDEMVKVVRRREPYNSIPSSTYSYKHCVLLGQAQGLTIGRSVDGLFSYQLIPLSLRCSCAYSALFPKTGEG